MKKTIAFLLAFLLCLNLCACGSDTPAKGDDDEDENEYEALVEKYEELLDYMEEGNYQAAMDYVEGRYTEQQAQVPDVPADAETIYENTLYALERYQSGSNYYVEALEKSLDGNDLLAYIYDQFVQLGDYKDSEEYLARFTVLPDVQLSVDYVSTDNLGNQGSVATSTYRYDRDGNPTYYFYRMNDDHLTTQLTLGYRNHDMHCVYDEQGNLSQLEFGYFYTDSSTLYAVTTFTWEDGKPVSSTTQIDTGGTYDTTYVFDEAGRISEITLDDSPYNTYVTTFTYDENGNLTQKTSIRYHSSGSLADRHTWTYTLDDNSHPVRMTYSYEYSYDSGLDAFYHTQEDIHEYTCDSQGRILTDTVTYGQIYYRNGDVTNPISVSTVYTYTYGDYYFFE